MNAYIDSSVLLRIVLGEPGRLAEWHRLDGLVSSEIIELECARTLDRIRLAGVTDALRIAERLQSAADLLKRVALIDLDRPILRRSALPLPAPLGTLDSLHLTTALLWREQRDPDLMLATHDEALGRVAQAMGISVIGCTPA